MDRAWEYVNRSQIHECENWEQGRVVLFLGIFVSSVGTMYLESMLLCVSKNGSGKNSDN